MEIAPWGLQHRLYSPDTVGLLQTRDDYLILGRTWKEKVVDGQTSDIFPFGKAHVKKRQQTVIRKKQK